ncbi:MAG: hypothetical protein K2K98_04045 [Muribaculaceae bacterium]|nr:hypothetical protein [Muribaculaceae bacterium]
MKFSRLVLLNMLAVWSGLVLSCSRHSTIDDRLTEAEALISIAPDSAQEILEDIRFHEATNINERQKAYLCILIAKAKNSQGKTFLTDESFDSSISYLESVSDTVGLIDIYQLAAIKKRWLLQQDSAAYYLSKAIELAPDSSGGFKSGLCIKLSNLYAFPTLPKDYDAAVKYAKFALKTASSPEDKARALHDIGLFQSYINHNDSAVIYMERALNETDPDNPEYDTYALNYAALPNADLRRSISFLDKIKGKHLGKMITLGFLYLNNSRLDSATCYLSESKSIYYNNPSLYSINTYNSLQLLEQSIGLLKTGTIFPDRSTVTNDSISHILDTHRKVAKEQSDYNNLLQIRILESKNKRQSILIVSLTAILFLCIFLGLFIRRTKRKFMKLRKELENIKIQQIMSEANENPVETESSENLIRKRLDLCIEQFRISRLQIEIDRIELQYRSSGSFPTIKDRGVLQQELIGCFADFVVDLKMTGARLNVDDIITCIMSCLKESNAAIAACLGTTETAVRTRKSRLRTKLTPEMTRMMEL